MNKYQALNRWFSDFAPAYVAGSVPDDVEPPYITYQPAWGMFGDKVSIPATLWSGSASEAKANDTAGMIHITLGIGGDVIKCDEGAMWVTRGTPFMTASSETEPGSKARYFNFEIEFLTA